MTIVPLLTLIFTHEGFPAEHVVRMAIATAMATILFTSVASARAHARRGAVLWHVVWGLAPGILIGSLLGPQVISGMRPSLLCILFGAFAGVSALRMLFESRVVPTRKLPGKVGLFGVGAGIGVASSMVGAGWGEAGPPMACRSVALRLCGPARGHRYVHALEGGAPVANAVR